MLERSKYFTPEHEQFRVMVRRFIESDVAPFHEQWEEDGVVSREVFKRAGEFGLLCPSLSESYGGGGGDWMHVAVVLTEMGRAGLTGPGFAVHSEMVVPYIEEYGTDSLREKFLPPMARGELIGAIAMTEPDAGSDLRSIRTRAESDGDHYIITGQKTYISNGQLADIMIVACKTAPDAGARGVSLIAVETDRHGFERGRQLKKIGLKAQDTSEIFFSSVRVPKDNLIGDEGAGFGILMSKLARERLSIAVKSIAVARSLLEMTIEYTKARKAFGSTIGEFQNTRFVIAGLDAHISAVEAYIEYCIGLFMSHDLSSVDAARAKLLATEIHCKTVDDCLQFFGGNGYMYEYPIARAYVDARISRIAGGASEVMKQIISKELFGNK